MPGAPAALRADLAVPDRECGIDSRFAAGLLGLVQLEAAREGRSAAQLLGLEPSQVAELAAIFPGSLGVPPGEATGHTREETALRDLLELYRARGDAFAAMLPAIFARRCQRPNHLWQDLGLVDRADLRALIERHFPRLAARNPQDMKWKKFFYRQLCSATGFGLCAAPVCTECDDYAHCFGAEDGEPLLAMHGGREH